MDSPGSAKAARGAVVDSSGCAESEPGAVMYSSDSADPCRGPGRVIGAVAHGCGGRSGRAAGPGMNSSSGRTEGAVGGGEPPENVLGDGDVAASASGAPFSFSRPSRSLTVTHRLVVKFELNPPELGIFAAV